MKTKDFALIALVVIVSGVASLLLSNMLISSPKNRQSEVEVVEKITSDFPAPDSKYFNSTAVDPTKPIKIGENANAKPFANQ